MLSTLLPIVTEDRFVQYKNVHFSMLFIPSPMMTVDRLEHSLNAYSIRVVTLLGIIREVRLEQFSKAHLPMLST